MNLVEETSRLLGSLFPGDTKWRLISAVVLEEFPFVTLHTPYLYSRFLRRKNFHSYV